MPAQWTIVDGHAKGHMLMSKKVHHHVTCWIATSNGNRRRRATMSGVLSARRG